MLLTSGMMWGQTEDYRITEFGFGNNASSVDYYILQLGDICYNGPHTQQETVTFRWVGELSGENQEWLNLARDTHNRTRGAWFILPNKVRSSTFRYRCN